MDKSEYFNRLKEFALEKTNTEIKLSTPIGKVFPLKRRFLFYNEFEEKTNYQLPDFALSHTNIVVRILVLLLTLILVTSTILNFIFYVAINSPSAFLGVLAFCLVFPFSIVSFFFPTYIKKSGFGEIKTVDDFVNEIVVLNQNSSRNRKG